MTDDSEASVGSDAALAFDGETMLMLVVAGRQLRECIDASLAEIGMTMRHVSALGHLKHRTDLSYSDLARRSGITAQSMRATIAQLQQLGAINAVTAGQGQRARLEITPTGRDLVRQARQIIAALETRMLGRLDDETRATLRRALPMVLAQTSGTPPPTAFIGPPP
ncbi:MarR family winged helix-turn-helix transcriptional regulator [Mycolicibacterium sp. Dal123E01]|uniref:MarR family winged helix-turn-helix transcriptional regulator n=1 Tax=Mycolicibacterium sp. Dal123E01 TaxID=3457578 RepID=UPI00403E842B